jgi:hypothetical protein
VTTNHSGFTEILSFPLPPTVSQGPPQVSLLLDGIFDLEMEMPLTYDLGGLIPQESYATLKTSLIEWVEACLEVLGSEAMFCKASVEKEGLARMVRALGFARGLDMPHSPQPDRLYFRCRDALAAIAIHRYSTIVLLPTAHQHKALATKDKRGSKYTSLILSIDIAVEMWVSYISDRLPLLLKASVICCVLFRLC